MERNGSLVKIDELIEFENGRLSRRPKALYAGLECLQPHLRRPAGSQLAARCGHEWWARQLQAPLAALQVPHALEPRLDPA
eukprot:19728-Prymnesium_polylepis.1